MKDIEEYEEKAGLSAEKLNKDLIEYVISKGGRCSQMAAMRAALTKQLGEDYVDDKLINVVGIAYCVMYNFEMTLAKCGEQAEKNN